MAEAEGLRQGRSLRRRVRWTAELVQVLAPRELRTRYRQSTLDIAWALITPVTVALVYGIVLTRSFNASGDGVPYLSMAWCGLVLWTFFANSLSGSVGSLIASSGLITKVYFPKEALPLAVVAASLTDLVIGLATILVLLPIQGVQLTPMALAAVLPLLVLIVWSAALGVLAAVVAAFVRDVPHLIALVIRVGFFATPVMYEASSLPPAWQWTAEASPVAAAIVGFREAVLRGESPDLPVMAAQLAAGSLLLCGSILYTRAVEARITDVV